MGTDDRNVGREPWDRPASHPCGSSNIPSHFMLQKPELNAGLKGHLARMHTLPYSFLQWKSSLNNRVANVLLLYRSPAFTTLSACLRSAWRDFSERLLMQWDHNYMYSQKSAGICRVLKISLNLGHVLLGLFRNRITRNRRYSCSFGSYSVFGMNGMSFRSFCSR